MNTSRKPSAQRVQDALIQRGFTNQVIELEISARTSAEAAEAVGCEVAQIAKSLIFATESTNRPILVIASGANRVDTEKVGALVGERLVRADPNFVREQTGYAIGGIPPLGHANPIETYTDADLLQWPTIWAAAGHPNALFQLTPDQLVAMTGGVVADVAQKV
jgi:prolyl-tRNA editing enzyme YbaK/EbsC (Cys-tRNA(Pro) deacylase)